jgi:hypothetical protein
LPDGTAETVKAKKLKSIINILITWFQKFYFFCAILYLFSLLFQSLYKLLPDTYYYEGEVIDEAKRDFLRRICC